MDCGDCGCQRMGGRVHGPGGRDTAIWRVSPPPTPPDNVAELSESVMAGSFAATLRGGGHVATRERLLFFYTRGVRRGCRTRLPGNRHETEQCFEVAAELRLAGDVEQRTG
jgi:hypothetical protein